MAGFLKALKNAFIQGSSNYLSDTIDFTVKCKKCSEEIKVKIRKASDISRIYDDNNAPAGTAYFARKEILGSKCNNLISSSMYFDESFNMISKEISGGIYVESA